MGRRHGPGPAPAILLLMVLALAYWVTQCHLQPAIGQTVTPPITPRPAATATAAVEPVLWLPVAADNYAAPITSNCGAPDACAQEMSR